MWEIATGDPQTANTKVLVFRILCTEFPLTITDLHEEIKSRFGIKITYQAVRKAVNALVTQGVVDRGDDKLFRLRTDWLDHTKQLIDTTLLAYRNPNRAIQVGDSEYSCYTMYSLYQADNFWNNTLIRLAELSRKEDQLDVFCFWHYAWWMLIKLGGETELFNYYIQNKHHVVQYVYRDLPLNHWAVDIYKDIGVDTRIQEVHEVTDTIAYNILGSYVIQVAFPEEALETIRNLFENHDSIQTIDHGSLRALAHKPYEVQFTVFRNPHIARYLCSTLAF